MDVVIPAASTRWIHRCDAGQLSAGFPLLAHRWRGSDGTQAGPDGSTETWMGPRNMGLSERGTVPQVTVI